MPVAPVPVAEWRPDVADLAAEFATEALNVVPGARSYSPLSSPSAISEPLPSLPKGGFLARRLNGESVIFAGTDTALYRLDTTNYTWVDISRLVGGAYNVPEGENWSFSQFGPNVIAVDVNDVPQVMNIETDTEFSDLAGNPPRSRLVAVYNDYTFLLADLTNPNRTTWSGTNDIEQWTPGSDNSDFQDHPEGGDVTGMSGDLGLIFLRRRIRRITPTRDAFVFQFDDFEPRRGCIAPYGLVKAGGMAFYLAEDGFYAATAGGTLPIGEQQVNDFFFRDIGTTELGQVVGTADARESRVFWAYRSVNNNNPYFDRLIIYDWELQKWSHAAVNLYGVFQAATPGITLEALDALYGSMDAMTVSLDSPIFQGGQPVVAVFDSLYRLAFLVGPALEAIVETSEIQLTPGARSFVQGITPLVDTSVNAVATVAGRSRRSDALTYKPELPQNSQGECPVRCDGRTHRFRVRIPAGETWQHVQGVQVEFDPSGER